MIHRFAIGQTDFGITTTASGAGGSVNISAGSTSISSNAFTFSNSNGVTFGIDTNANITASVQTNYQTPGAYLTTAMASNRGSDFVQATAAFHGTNASGTINSNNISVSVAAPAAASINISAGTTSSNVTAATFSNANGVSFGYDGTNVTATVATNYQSQGAYLTTAALSQDSSKYAGTGFTTATTAGTNVIGTLNTGGLSMGVPAYITTAMQSNAATISNIKISAGASSSNVSAVTFSNSNGVSFGYDGTNVTATVATNYAGTGTSATNASITLNTAGLAISVAAGSNSSWTVSDNATSMTVARLAFTQSNGLTLSLSTTTGGSATVVGSYTVPSTAGLLSNINVSAGAVSNNLSAITFSNSNGISFGLSASTITASYTVPTVTNSSWTVSDSATSATVGRLMFSNANGVSFGLSTSNNGQQSVTASIATTYAGTGFTTATTAGTAIVGTHNTAGLSMGVPAYLTTAEQSRQPLSYFANMPIIPFAALPTSTADSNTFYICPLTIPEKLSISYLRLIAFATDTTTTIATSAVNNATGASTAFSLTLAANAVLYTVGSGANSRSLQEVYSSSAGLTWAVSVSQASTSNASQQSITQRVTYPSLGFSTANTSTQYSVSSTNAPISTFGAMDANKFLDIPFATSLSAGNYWLAINQMSGTVGGKSMGFFFKTYGMSQTNLSMQDMFAVLNVSNCQFQLGLGSWTTNVAQTTASIAFASISATSSYWIPYVQLINQA